MREQREKTKELRKFYRDLMELERRASLIDPFYLAKWIIGREREKKGTSVLSADHEGLLKDVWGLWMNRHLRPFKTHYACIWPRGTLKSSMLSVAFPVAVILNDPNVRILIDASTEELAKKWLRAIKDVIADKFFFDVFGDLKDGSKWVADHVTVKRTASLPEPTISLGGLSKNLTGNHYDLIIADDIQTEDNSNSLEAIEGVVTRWKLYDSLLDKNGMVVLPMTRWTFNDLGEYLIKVADDDKEHLRPQRIWINHRSAYKKDGEGKLDFEQLDFPQILTRDMLGFLRASQGPFLFSCNYLCQPQSDDTATFKKEWIRYHEYKKREDIPEKNDVYFAIDPAGEGKFRGADYNVIISAAITEKFDIYVLDVFRAHVSDMELLEKILEMRDKFQPAKIGIEEAFKQHQLAAWMKAEAAKRMANIFWYTFKTTRQQKTRRIRSLQPYTQAGKLYIRKDMTALEDELLRYTPGSDAVHDDMVDALAYIVEFMKTPAVDQPREFWMNTNWKEDGSWKGREDQMPSQSSIRMMKWEKARKAVRTRPFIPTSRSRMYA